MSEQPKTAESDQIERRATPVAIAKSIGDVSAAKMFHGILSLATIGFVFSGLLVAGYFLYSIRSEQQVSKQQLELLNKNYVKQNQQTVLLQIIDKKLEGAPTETKINLATTIYNLSAVKKIPASLICGLIEIESGWNPKICSNANAKGLMQVLPSSARPYLRAERIEYKPVTLEDPVVNVIVGISLLADLHAGHLESGYAKENDYTMALHSYFWGPSNTSVLYGKKDSRVNVPNMSYPQRVLKAASSYRELLKD